jgi:hypothetical protein
MFSGLVSFTELDQVRWVYKRKVEPRQLTERRTDSLVGSVTN